MQRQISQQPQQQSQQKFYVAKQTNSPATSSNIVKIQQNQKIFIQSSPKVYVSGQSNPQVDDLSHLE